MAATLSFREALSQGIASGTFVDTKIILFSRRTSSGRVCGPKTLYASSHVLKSIPYFNHLLFGNFLEAESQDLSGNFDDDESSNDYGYYSDSDLEDDGETVDTLKGVLKMATQPKNTARDVLRTVTPQKGTLKRVLRTDSLRRLGGGTFHKPPREKYAERACKGKVVKVPDMAFITFQAFLLYLYSGEIEFASLKLGTNRRRRSVGLLDPSHDDLPRPSPRSVYRLADKYDVPAFKKLSLCRIRTELKNCDIVQETFSKFASKYEEIRTECVIQLVSTLVNDTTAQTTWTRVSAIIDRHSRGDLEHVAEALSLLWSTVNQRGCATTLLNGQPSVLPAPVRQKPYELERPKGRDGEIDQTRGFLRSEVLD
ncbi:hypothetical protein BDM02DRAFT_490316 [Thelephora ganbajun]|uniref:Uncharacterized protein n=1 Tax=Thelephora ganbajun TaxID=370292 RepID=A0ACB6Z7A5_THEGA|nr:hypothetical protein BDM02DRAFT_490316 [Thelephora ganbajun]